MVAGSGVVPRMYGYVNRDETHEVIGQATSSRDGDGVDWTVLERPRGSTERPDWLELRETVRHADVPLRVTDLETRLASTGEWWRVVSPEGVAAPLPAPPPMDLRAHAAPIPDAPQGTYLEYFHFHRHGDTSRVLLAMPRFHANELDRFILAQYEFPSDKPSEGEVQVIHPRLPPVTVVGQVAGSHIELPRRGYRKLFDAGDYERALGRDWRARAGAVLAAAAGLLVPRRAWDVPAEAVEVAEDADAARVRAALASRAYRSVRDEHLPDAREAERLMVDGELGIARLVREARRRASHTDQPRLSLLEAGLLVEYGLRAGRERLVNEHAPRLTRLARDYERLV